MNTQIIKGINTKAICGVLFHPLCGIVQLANSNASQMTFRLLRFWNWSFTIINNIIISFPIGGMVVE